MNRGMGAGVNTLSLRPCGTEIASGGNDSTVRRWSFPSGELLQTLEVFLPPEEVALRTSLGEIPDNHAVECVAYGVNGKSLAFGGEFFSIQLWDLLNGRRERIFQTGCFIFSIALNEHFLVSGDHDFSVCLWSLMSGQRLHTWGGHSGDVKSVLFHPQRKDEIISGGDQTVRSWRIPLFLEEERHRVLPKSGLVLSPTGLEFATGSLEGGAISLEVRNLSNGKLKRFFKMSEDIQETVFSPEGTQLAVAAQKDLFLWDWVTGGIVHTFHNIKAYTLSFGTHSSELLTIGEEATEDETEDVPGGERSKFTPHIVSLWRVPTGALISSWRSTSLQNGVFSGQGKLIASKDQKNRDALLLWDTARGHLLRRFSALSRDVPTFIFKGQDLVVRKFNQDLLTIWDTESRGQWDIAVREGFGGSTAAAGWGDSETVLALSYNEGVVDLYRFKKSSTIKDPQVVQGCIKEFLGDVRLDFRVPKEEPVEAVFLITGGYVDPIRYWRIICERNGQKERLKGQLLWSLSQNSLVARGLDLRGAELSTDHRLLFGQYGALPGVTQERRREAS